MFRETIENMHQDTECTDTGSDANIGDDRLLNEFRTKGLQMKAGNLKQAELFHVAPSLLNGQQAKLKCI